MEKLILETMEKLIFIYFWTWLVSDKEEQHHFWKLIWRRGDLSIFYFWFDEVISSNGLVN